MRRTDRGPQVDALVRVHYGGAVRLLVVEVKAHGAPRFVRSAVLQSYAARIRQHPAHAAELRTDARLSLPFPRIARHLPRPRCRLPRPRRQRPPRLRRRLHRAERPHQAEVRNAPSGRSSPPSAISGPRSRTGPGSPTSRRAPTQASASQQREREWVDRRHDGIVLTQPDALVQTWRENYRRPRGDRFDAYTHLHGRQFDELGGGLNARPGSPRAVYALASAAQWIAPFSRDATRSFYTDATGARILRETLELRPGGSGPNVVLHAIADESIFDDAIEPLPGLFCTSPIVTYLDLWCGNDREREAADHLARETLPWIA